MPLAEPHLWTAHPAPQVDRPRRQQHRRFTRDPFTKHARASVTFTCRGAESVVSLSLAVSSNQALDSDTSDTSTCSPPFALSPNTNDNWRDSALLNLSLPSLHRRYLASSRLWRDPTFPRGSATDAAGRLTLQAAYWQSQQLPNVQSVKSDNILDQILPLDVPEL